MYIQPDRPIPPKNYSGSAFSREGTPLFHTPAPEPTREQAPTPEASPTLPTVPQALPESVPETPLSIEPTAASDPEHTEEAVQVGSTPHSGLLSRLPFLSSFLPPPRGRDGKNGLSLPDWVLIGAMVLLFLSEGDNDILPFLLLLLLWD